MADEEEVEEGAEKPKKKGGSKILLIIIVVLLLALIGVGAMLFMGGGDEEKPPVDAAEQAALEEAAAPQVGEIMALDPFIVNLASERGRRYLKVSIQIEVSNKTLSTEINNKMPEIKDTVITMLSSKTTDELLTVEGKFALKEQILTRINSSLKTGVVKNVYFVEFVIQ